MQEKRGCAVTNEEGRYEGEMRSREGQKQRGERGGVYEGKNRGKAKMILWMFMEQDNSHAGRNEEKTQGKNI